jgi:hypothetical protein
LAIIVFLAAMMLVIYPLVLSRFLEAPALGLLAFAWLFAAAVVWQVQSMQPLLSLLSLALFFSFYVPAIASLWFDAGGVFVPFRLVALVVGVLGFGAWLYRLPRMTEEDDDYLVPVQAGGANASRIEKSETRRLLARAISRSSLTSWVTDAWHDRLAGMAAVREQARGRLLRYGTLSVPAPVMAINLFLMAALIIGTQYVMLTSGQDDLSTTRVPAMILAQLGGFSLLVMPIVCQFLSMRRPRFAQDLMLPMTRETFVDGLFRAVVEAGLWGMAPVLLVLVAGAAMLAPEYLMPNYVTAGLVTIGALVPLAAGISFRLVLVGSGMKRMVVLVVLMYPLVGLAIGLFAVTAYVNLALGIVLGLAIGGLGVAVCRWARRVWLEAELGCL